MKLHTKSRRSRTFAALTVLLVVPCALLLAPLPAAAQETVKAETPAPVGKNGATVTRWAEGLKGPQGIVLHGKSVLVIENGSGNILRFPLEGGKGEKFAEGLQAPAYALPYKQTLLVAERAGNSIALVAADGKVTRLAGAVTDPLGLALTPDGALLALSHRESVIRRYRLENGVWTMEATPFSTPTGGAKYGWRDMAVGKDGSIYVTDELSNAILVRRADNTFTPFVSGLSSPGGLVVTPDGTLYVTEEGTGRLSRITKTGAVEVLAEGMGKAREAVVLDSRTLLVTDRAGGAIWKVVLPR